MCICNFEYALISYYNTHNRFIIHIVDWLGELQVAATLKNVTQQTATNQQ